MKKNNWNYAIILAGTILMLANSCSKDDSSTNNCISAPAVTTAPISSFDELSASGGGEVHFGANIDSRGICWSTSPNPTKDLATKTSDGSGIGSFNSTMNGLSPLTNYYVCAYATNCAGTSYGEQVYFNSSIFIGNHYKGGIIAYVLQPGESGYKKNEQHGIIAALNDASSSAAWGCVDSLISGAKDTVLFAGKKNTLDIVNANGGCVIPGITAASLCNDLVSEGFSDWYLPSRDELNKLFINRDKIGGFSADDYWTSSQFTDSLAWRQSFSDGSQQHNFLKSNTMHVRAIRAF